jgi:hypothetical protein
MELENIQALLDDSMEMVQGGEQLPPGIEIETVDAISKILSEWFVKISSDEEVETPQQEISAISIACAYIAGRLESMQDEMQDGAAGETISYNIEPTHPEGQNVTINFNFR